MQKPTSNRNTMNRLNIFKKPSAKSIAQVDLEEAERQVLVHRASADYHTKMAEYYAETVRRLSEYIKEEQAA